MLRKDFADLDPSSAGEKVVADANMFRARSLFECGMGQYRDGRRPRTTSPA